MTHITCRLTAKNRDQLRNPILSNWVWATFLPLCAARVWRDALVQSGLPCTSEHELCSLASVARRGTRVRHQPRRPSCQETGVGKHLSRLPVFIKKTFLLICRWHAKVINFTIIINSLCLQRRCETDFMPVPMHFCHAAVPLVLLTLLVGWL